MIKLFVFCFNFLIFQKDSSVVTFDEYQDAVHQYKQLLVDIREYQLTPIEARSKFQDMMLVLKKSFPNAKYDSTAMNLCFPLLGFDYRAVGGYGSGFRPEGYDLFDQNAKGSHPAHDIFMLDRNQDSKDDRTGDYVPVLSVSNGIVIATENEWQPGSVYRGGNYIWIFDTNSGGLWYYAHQREIYVQTGDKVIAGQKIALVGRTGYNAAMKRSDTHLHLTYLKIDEAGNPTPVNTYPWLKKASTLLDPRIEIKLESIKIHEMKELQMSQRIKARIQK